MIDSKKSANLLLNQNENLCTFFTYLQAFLFRHEYFCYVVTWTEIYSSVSSNKCMRNNFSNSIPLSESWIQKLYGLRPLEVTQNTIKDVYLQYELEKIHILNKSGEYIWVFDCRTEIMGHECTKSAVHWTFWLFYFVS